MKTIGHILCISITTLCMCMRPEVFAQDAFTGINYQAVAVDRQGKAIAGVDIVGNKLPEKEIAVRFEILAGHPDGAVVYQEYHTTNTDQFGMFSLIIGQGEATDGGHCSALVDIPWEADRYFLRVYLNIRSSALNPDHFTLASVEPLSAVPYALHARTADRVSDSAVQDFFTNAHTSGDTLFFTNTEFVLLDTQDGDADARNELQILSMSNDTIYLSQGGFVRLPSGFDGDFHSLTSIPAGLADGDTDTHLTEAEVDAYVADNGYLTAEADGSEINELQFLSLSNDTIYLTNGGFVKLPGGFDGDFYSLSNIPPGLADGDDNTHLSEAEVDVYVADNGFLTAEVDGSLTNELQVLSISNDTIYLSQGGFAVLPAAFTGNYEDLANKPDLSQYLTTEQDGSSTNEIQSLSVSARGDTLYLSQSNYIIIPGVSNFNLPSVSDADGNVYGTVGIGTQVWMAKNLQTTSFSNGDPIPTTATPDLDITSESNPIYYWPAGADEINVPEYGRLYTGYVATDPRNVCPAGWHVPTYAEWMTLINYLGGVTLAGGPLKEVGFAHWKSPNTGATNDSGFTARAAGFRYDNGFYYFSKEWTRFWTSDSNGSGGAYETYLYFGQGSAERRVGNMRLGYSIRCIQD